MTAEYDQIVAAFLTPSASHQPAPALPVTPARMLRDALEPVATVGWWSRPAAEALAALGLDFVGGYVWGRAASFGADVEPDVVVAAFGVFASDMIVPTLLAARVAVTRESVLAAREAGATEALRLATASLGPAPVDWVGRRLLEALRATEGTGRALFSALRALPVPGTPLGALWRAAELFREHRGDSHLAACVAAGLDPVQMNVLTELWLGFPLGEYSASRAFPAERVQRAEASLADREWVSGGRLTKTGLRAREEIETATDMAQADVLARLGDDIGQLTESAALLSGAVLAAGFAPVDPRKRAAG